MNEKEAMEYIAYLNTLGSKPGLTVIRELLRRAGDPQKELAFIHIAGTNGKGSVSAFISNILMAAGYRVGRYNSPTIRTYRGTDLCQQVHDLEDSIVQAADTVENML